MTKWLKNKRVNTLLGLSFEADRVDGAVLRKVNGGIDISNPFASALVGDLATVDPQIIGAELRKHLDSAGIHERNCVVGLPAAWVLSCQSHLPELAEADVDDFLDLEAERGFAYTADELIICRSKFKSLTGSIHVTQVAVPRENVERMEQILRAARLSPVSFSTGLCAGFGSQENVTQGILNLFVNESSVGFLAVADGGISVIRTLQLPPATKENGASLSVEAARRELRVTLGQLQPEVRATVRGLQIVGGGPEGDQLYQNFGATAKAWGLSLQRGQLKPAFGLENGHTARVLISSAMLLAAQRLSGQPPAVEFLPPRLSAWKQFTSQYASKKLVYSGVAAGALAGLVLIAFLIQQVRLSGLRSQWLSLKTPVQEIEEMQQEIKKFRSWYDDSLRNLNILRRLTEAFPQEGTVVAKILEIHSGGVVTCSGTANDHAALLKTLDRLRASTEVTEVQVDQLRGKAPLQFTFNFKWTGATPNL